MPFNVVIPDAKQDKALPEKLRKEWPGILRWAVEGCNQWQAIGLAEPEEILGATKQYRGEEDVLGSFFNEWCAKGPGHVVRCLELYEAYKRWAEKSGLKRIMPQNRFARVMTERGFERESMNRATWYQGSNCSHASLSATAPTAPALTVGTLFPVATRVPQLGIVLSTKEIIWSMLSE